MLTDRMQNVTAAENHVFAWNTSKRKLTDDIIACCFDNPGKKIYKKDFPERTNTVNCMTIYSCELSIGEKPGKEWKAVQ